MAVITWLLLSLLIVHTVTGRDIRHREAEDASDTLESLLKDWEPKSLARHNTFQSQLEDGKLSKVRRTENINQDTCGVPAIAPSVNVRVVGGVEAVQHSWPWMVSLQYNGRHFCGGSLINNQWVVSAAHCYGRVGMEIEAVIGLHRHSEPDSFTIRVPVAQVILNKKYRNPMSPSATSFTTDIMLLKLAHPVEFNDAVSPVCLPTLFQVLPSATRCYSSGWGRLRTGGDTPDELMQVMLPLIDNEVCNQPTWHSNKLDDSMVCAGFEEGQRGNCHGDSGGPLVCRDGDHWILYGIVSWGSIEGCAVTNGPTVYNRASAYVRWISETINENSE